MKTSVVLPRDLGRPELDRWREIVSGRSDFDNPFLSPGFALAVGRTRPAARVAVVEEGGRIVAFFAFERRPLGLALPIGAGLSDCQAIIAEPETELEINRLLAQCGIATWSFDHLVATQRPMLAPSSIERGSALIDVSEGFEAYLAQKGRQFRKVAKSERRLAAEFGPVRFGFDVRDDVALSRMIEWKSEQYRRTGRPDRFSSRSTVDLVRDLAGASGPDLWGTLSTLHAGDRLVAVDFSLRSPTTLAGWFSSYDRELSRHSPGSIRRLRTIEAAGLAGLLRYELGKGEEEYKNELKTGDRLLCEGWVVRPVALGHLRRAMSRPREMVLDAVLRHPRLRSAARETLERLGSARLRLQRTVRAAGRRT
jgi:CelD/BcsL family acetyltransferase involved in cellulose biosynthesis